MKKAKTREQLEAEGILLYGPLVPEFFKLQSDGCSIPLGRVGRFLMRAKQARPACYIHDYRYYLMAILWATGAIEWVNARFSADYELKLNRKLVAKYRFFGKIYAAIYFRPVRTGGRLTIKKPSDLFVPPTIVALEAVEKDLLTMEDPLTERAEALLKYWRKIIEDH